MFDSKPDIDADNSEGETPKDVQGRLQFENVSFRYPTRPDIQVLNNLSLTVEPGTYVALVGASGCGKSTTIQLIERFYDPTSGCITLNHEDIADMSPQLYRKYMSLVQQEPPLYQGTVRENIAIGLDHQPSDDEVTEVELAGTERRGLGGHCGFQSGGARTPAPAGAGAPGTGRSKE